MVHAMPCGLDMAIEHRGICGYPQSVGRAMDLKPCVAIGLARSDLSANLRVEYFRAHPG